MIPAILHQTWKSKREFPPNFEFWRKSFLECNPGIDYRLYDDEDNRQLLIDTFPELLSLYNAFPGEIFRVDFIRALYLFKWGGFYADLDFQCLQPFSSFLEQASGIVLGKMGTDDSHPDCLPNALMASNPGEGFWLGFLSCIENAWRLRDKIENFASRPEAITGPRVLRRAVLQFKTNPEKFRESVINFVARHHLQIDPNLLVFNKITILPGHVWYPLNWSDKIHHKFKSQLRTEKKLLTIPEARDLFPKSMAVTYWSNSWFERAEDGFQRKVL